MLFYSLYKSEIDLVGQFFLKMMLGDLSEWEDKTISGGGESTMDDAMLIEF